MNLPLLGVARVTPVPAGAGAPLLLAATDPEDLKPAVEVLTQTRQSLTLHSLLLTGFPHDPEFFAAGLALAREWSRRGLKVAVVDLDYRHPTVVRPMPHPAEGFVDVLEYGCSYRRVAWELVADALWLVGPGSHPLDEERFTDHPDWDRAIRVFSNQADVALYLAPFLDRKGLAGRISKRMDAVLLVASVERAGRSALRDAFLELWGSDAPMIGCLGIGSRRPPAPEPARRADDGNRAALAEAPPSGRAGSAGGPPSAAPESPPGRDVPEGSGHRKSDGDLVHRLSEEVRTGSMPRVRRRSRVSLLTGVTVALAAAIGTLAAVVRLHRPPSASAPQETLPAGTEEVIPARVGGSGPQALPPEETPALTPAAAPQMATAPAEPPPAASAPAIAPAPLRDEAPRDAAPYRVHVASLRSEPQARDLVKTLRAREFDAWYEAAPDQRGWYRVFVGHYATREEAAARARWLLDHGRVDRAFVYPDIER